MLTSLGYRDRDLSILFVDDKKIAQLNGEYFSKDYPTNVISFSYIDGLPDEVLGDIIISVERAEEEANASGTDFYERLFSLIVHGIVHIMGHDHVRGGAEAKRMHNKEMRCMALVQAHNAYKVLVGNHQADSPHA